MPTIHGMYIPAVLASEVKGEASRGPVPTSANEVPSPVEEGARVLQHYRYSLQKAPQEFPWWRTTGWAATTGLPSESYPIYPMRVRAGGRVREFHDGGGFCSPGRLPSCRRPCGKLHFLLPIVEAVIVKYNLQRLLRTAMGTGETKKYVRIRSRSTVPFLKRRSQNFEREGVKL